MEEQEQDQVLSDAIAMVFGAGEELPPYIKVELADSAGSNLTAWVFAEYQQAAESVMQEMSEDEQEQVLPNLIRQAVIAAYIAGALDATDATNQPQNDTESLEVSGGQGPININITIKP